MILTWSRRLTSVGWSWWVSRRSERCFDSCFLPFDVWGQIVARGEEKMDLTEQSLCYIVFNNKLMKFPLNFPFFHKNFFHVNFLIPYRHMTNVVSRLESHPCPTSAQPTLCETSESLRRVLNLDEAISLSLRESTPRCRRLTISSCTLWGQEFFTGNTSHASKETRRDSARGIHASTIAVIRLRPPLWGAPRSSLLRYASGSVSSMPSIGATNAYINDIP